MAAYLKIAGIDGEATDKAHKGWIQIESISESITRSITAGARDVERMRGDTNVGDIAFVRQLDSSSMALKEACAKGELQKEVTLHVTTQLGDKETTFLEYVLTDVIVSGYGASVDGANRPTETITMNYTKVEWTYTELDPKTGKEVGKHPASFDPSMNATK